MSDLGDQSGPGAGRHPVLQSSMRRAIARRMAESKASAPHFYVSTEVEMDAVISAADELNQGRSKAERVTITSYLVRAAALALAHHPAFNAIWTDGRIAQVDSINVGVAIALDDGLIAPALMDCRDRDIPDLALGLADLVRRSRAGGLRPAEVGEGTFTLSNLGMFDVTTFTAIVNPPQVAILATARTLERPVIRDGTVVARRIMSATLSADHRVVDGIEAARFLESFKSLLEAPGLWPKAGS